MTLEKFSDLWKNVGNAAQDIVNSCKDGTLFDEKKESYIHYEYNKLRDYCKKQHLKVQGTIHPDKDPLLDRHKVAACIAGAILSTRPMESPAGLDSDRSRLSYFSNEVLALFSALGIVKSFIRSDHDNVMNLDPDLKSDFLEVGFLFPEPLHDDYLPWLLFLLQESSKIGFNVLSFSNILYLLETHTFDQLKIQKLMSKSS